MIPVEDYKFDLVAELNRKMLDTIERLEDAKADMNEDAYLSALRALNDVSRGLADPDINFALDDVLNASREEFPKIITLSKQDKVIQVGIRPLSASVSIFKDGKNVVKNLESRAQASKLFHNAVTLYEEKGYRELKL